MSGTDLAYGAICLRACYALSGTDLAFGAIRLRARYALSGTGLSYGAIFLRACYGMSSTDAMNRVIAMRCPVLTRGMEQWRRSSIASGGDFDDVRATDLLCARAMLRMCCAQSGTDTAYAAMRCPVLTAYAAMRCPPGTDTAYVAKGLRCDARF
eukprot:701538-Rhodomonas_salina.1